jgi:hypothetical protein
MVTDTAGLSDADDQRFIQITRTSEYPGKALAFRRADHLFIMSVCGCVPLLPQAPIILTTAVYRGRGMVGQLLEMLKCQLFGSIPTYR